MIIAPNGVSLSGLKKLQIDMPEAITQLLIDTETFFVRLGLTYQIRCIQCMRTGDVDAAYCEGSSNDDHSEFRVTCGCTERIGKGTFTAPPIPAQPLPRTIIDEKRTYHLTRDEMKQIDAFEQALKRLGLQYLVRCLRCQLEGQPADGVYGAKASNASEFVMECACTKRIYKGADAPMLSH